MNPRELPEEPGLDRPLPRKEDKPAEAKPDQWRPYGEKSQGLEQNTRTDELRTNRPAPSKTTINDVAMRLRDSRCYNEAIQRKSPNTSSPTETTSAVVQSQVSDQLWKGWVRQSVGAFSVQLAEKSGVEQSSKELPTSSAPTAHAASTVMAGSPVLLSGGPKTNWLGTTTGRISQESGNSGACSNVPKEDRPSPRLTERRYVWNGSQCTGPYLYTKEKLVCVELRNGVRIDCTEPTYQDWIHRQCNSDIIAYYTIEENTQ